MKQFAIGLVVGLSLSTAYASTDLELLLRLTNLVKSIQQSVIENRLALCDLGTDHFDCITLKEELMN